MIMKSLKQFDDYVPGSWSLPEMEYFADEFLLEKDISQDRQSKINKRNDPNNRVESVAENRAPHARFRQYFKGSAINFGKEQ